MSHDVTQRPFRGIWKSHTSGAHGSSKKDCTLSRSPVILRNPSPSSQRVLINTLVVPPHNKLKLWQLLQAHLELIFEIDTLRICSAGLKHRGARLTHFRPISSYNLKGEIDTLQRVREENAAGCPIFVIRKRKIISNKKRNFSSSARPSPFLFFVRWQKSSAFSLRVN